MIIGIGGCSQSGKSTLASQLYKRLIQLEFDTVVLDIDDFVFAEERIPMIRDHVDWEVPASIDFAKYERAIIRARQQNQVVICVGFLVFNQVRVYRHFDCSIFVTVSKTLFVERKKHDLRWGREPDWYIEYIWSSFLKYGGADHLDRVIKIDGENKTELDQTLQFLQKEIESLKDKQQMQFITDLKKTQQQTLRYFDLPETDLDLRYAPGKWTIRQLLHHLADAETVLYERVRRVIARPHQVIWGFDQDLWAQHLDYHQIPLSVNRPIYEAVRNSVIRLAEKYYVSHGAHPFVHNETGARTLKDEFDKIAWHNAHHLKQIEQALAQKPGANLC